MGIDASRTGGDGQSTCTRREVSGGLRRRIVRSDDEHSNEARQVLFREDTNVDGVEHRFSISPGLVQSYDELPCQRPALSNHVRSSSPVEKYESAGVESFFSVGNKLKVLPLSSSVDSLILRLEMLWLPGRIKSYDQSGEMSTSCDQHLTPREERGRTEQGSPTETQSQSRVQ